MSSANSQPKRGLEPDGAGPDAKKQAISSTEQICSQCQVAKSRLVDYYKKQRNKPGGQCKDCWDNRKTTPHEKICSQCKVTKINLVDYYKGQRYKPDGRCIDCCEKRKARPEPPPPSSSALDPSVTMVCSDCGESKPQGDFSAKQRKLDSATCEACAAKHRKEQRKERLLAQRKERLRAQKKAFFLNHGVGYCLNPSFLGGTFEDDEEKDDEMQAITVDIDPDSKTLAGDYKVVYYYCHTDEDQRIARTARGSVRLRSTHWDTDEGSKPALCGEYKLFESLDPDSKIRGNPGGENPMGEITEGCFVENVVDWDPDNRYGFQEKGKKIIMDQSAHSTHACLNAQGEVTRKFWRTLLDPDNHGDNCKATLHQVTARRIPLALKHDELNGFDFKPNWRRLLDLDDDNLENALKQADSAMTKYNDTSESWIRDHLELPGKVALRIREFVMPKPVFFLKEGDLILKIRERLISDWSVGQYKWIVFRKID